MKIHTALRNQGNLSFNCHGMMLQCVCFLGMCEAFKIVRFIWSKHFIFLNLVHVVFGLEQHWFCSKGISDQHFCCCFCVLFSVKLDEAKTLVRDAITAGIFCDLGSGSNVDLCIITEAGAEYLRGYDKPAEKGKRLVQTSSMNE